MAVGDIYEVSLLGSVNGEKVANVLHYRVETMPATADPATDLAGAVEAGPWETVLRDITSEDYILQQVRARRIAPTLGGVVILAVNEDGDITEDTLPPNNCVVLSFYTARTDRSGRGRLHLAGIPETYVQDGLLTVAAGTSYANLGDALMSPIPGADGGIYQFGVYSKTVPEFNTVVRHQVRSWIHTIRGRRMVAP